MYPLLGIRRGSSVVPTNTYLTWQGLHTVHDYRFIAVYHMRDDADFKSFEEKHLLGNKYFDAYYELEDGKGAYVFDFTPVKSDYKKIVNGKYSRVSGVYKEKVLAFFKNHHIHHKSILSYLHPEEYHDAYAKDLLVTASLMKEVHEVCSLPDLEQEKLEIMKKVLNFDSVNHI